MTIPNRFWMPENSKDKPYVTQGPLAAAPYVECVRVDSLPGWQPIDRCFKKSPVLVWDDYWLMRIAQWDIVNSEWVIDMPCVDDHRQPISPTHWMPLPDPPKQAEEQPFSEYGNYGEKNPPV